MIQMGTMLKVADVFEIYERRKVDKMLQDFDGAAAAYPGGANPADIVTEVCK